MNKSKNPTSKLQSIMETAICLLKEGKRDEAYAQLISHANDLSKKEKIKLYYSIHRLFIKIDSIKALEALDAIIDLEKSSTMPLLLKANYFSENRKIKKSIETLKEMLNFEPSNNELVEAARIFSKHGEQMLALDCAKKAYFEADENLNIATYPLRIALQNADWEFADKITQKLLNSYQNNTHDDFIETPRTHLLWCGDEHINNIVIKKISQKNFNVNKQKTLSHSLDDDFKKRKLRIGYVSYDFRDHPTSYLIMGLLRHHNKSRFEIFLYDTSFDDNKATRRQIFSKADVVKDLSKLTDSAAAKVISSDKIDVLIDLNGLTDGSRLGIFSYRPAPIQISYLGFPGSTGSSFVDYIIADEYTLPKSSEQYYSESIIRITDTYQINDYIAQYLHPRPSLKSLGLPEGRPIIGMFNNVNKVGRQVWDTWMRIMKSAPEAVLWMLDPGDLAKANLMHAAKLSGVASDRFFWAKKIAVDQHLARLSHCSIALDPWPYGGHTTTSDALFAGVPVVSLEGSNFASRVSGGLIIAAGLKTLVAKDINDYIKASTRLLNDNNLLLNIKRHINENKGKLPVFDAVARTLQIEGAYFYAYELALKKSKPLSFNISLSVSNKKGS